MKTGADSMKILLLSALFISTLAAQNTSTIEGYVVDSVTGAGLANVNVYFGSDKDGTYDTQTDSSGRFQISGVKDGQYGCHFEKLGYIPQYSGTMDSALKSVRVSVYTPLG